MTMLYTTEFPTPFGVMKAASTEQGLAYLELPRANGRGFEGWLRRHARKIEVCVDAEANQGVVQQVVEFLSGERSAFDLALDLRCTSFQRRVYDALCAIPYGETRSYAEQAAAIGAPKAVRAVGTADGANPVPLVVPCHRVVASNGKLGGYGGGLEMKEKLLAMEQGRRHKDRLL